MTPLLERPSMTNVIFLFYFSNSTNNDKNIVYNDQPYFEEPIRDNQNFGLDDWVYLWCCLK